MVRAVRARVADPGAKLLMIGIALSVCCVLFVLAMVMATVMNHTQERKSNTLKDFLHVAGPLGVTHFLIFSATDFGSYLRVARVPHGPTLTFRISSCVLLLIHRVILPDPSTLWCPAAGTRSCATSCHFSRIRTRQPLSSSIRLL